MKCPNCGEEINNQSSVCENCGSNIVNTGNNDSSDKKRTSKLAVAALLSAILSFFTFGISLVFMAIFSRYALRAIKKSEGKLKGKYYVYTAKAISVVFILCVVVVFYYWHMDAEPIHNDYTIADLVSAPEEYNVTYDLLLSLEDYNDFIPKSHFLYEDEPSEETTDKLFNILKQIYADSGSNSTPIDINDFPDYRHIVSELESILSGMDYEKIHLLAQLIEEDTNKQWLHAAPAREIIDKLSQYEQIADLSIPNIHNYELSPFMEMRSMTFLYKYYIIVQVEHGNIDEPISELIKLNSIIRKYSVNARTLVAKLVCIAILAENLNTANYIVNHPRVTIEQVQILSQHFQPLTDSETSLKNAFISEHIMFRNALYDDILKSADKARFFAKPNSTLRIKRNIHDKALYDSGEIQFFNPMPMYPEPIAKLFDDSVVEDIHNYKIPLKDKIYNPVGIMMMSILMPAYNMIFEIKAKLRIDDDLFQIILNIRLGKEIDLKARAYSENYIIDIENHRLLSPGPDEITGTDDDIFREYNPDVINFESDNKN